MSSSAGVRVRDDEPAYVGHFWAAFVAGRACSRWNDAMVFSVRSDDVAAFPELAGAEVIALRITEDEVHETSPEDAAAYDE